MIDTRMIEKLKDKLAIELETVSRKTSMSSADLDLICKLTDAIKNLGKIEMYQDGGMSQRGYSMGDWSNAGMYDDNGSSYGRHWVRGHYSREDSREALRNNMDRMMSQENLNSEQRMALERAMNVL